MNGGYYIVPEDISKAIGANIATQTQITVPNSYNRMKNILATGKPILLVCEKIFTGTNFSSFLSAMLNNNVVSMQGLLGNSTVVINVSSNDEISFKINQ